MNNGSGISQVSASGLLARTSGAKGPVAVDIGANTGSTRFENALQNARHKTNLAQQERTTSAVGPRESMRLPSHAGKEAARLPIPQKHVTKPMANQATEAKGVAIEKTPVDKLEPKVKQESQSAQLMDASEEPAMLSHVSTINHQQNPEAELLEVLAVGIEQPLIPQELPSAPLLPPALEALTEEEQTIALSVQEMEGVPPAPVAALPAAPADILDDDLTATAESAKRVSNSMAIAADKFSGVAVQDEPAATEDVLLAGEDTSPSKNNAGVRQLSLPAEANTSQTTESRAAPPTPAVIAEAARATETVAVAGRGFTVQSQVGVAMGHPQWNQAVVNRVMWLSAQNLPSAELRLDPPELGPLQVRIQVQHDHVHVSFVSQNANVRDALDQQASRLREMFAENGMSLDVGVSDQAFSQRDQQQSASGGNGHASGAEDEEQTVNNAKILRLVDHYA